MAKGDYFEWDSIDWKMVVFWKNKCNLEYAMYVKQPNKMSGMDSLQPG
jgi:hypothetical protein